jgi:HSP20 family protein
MTIWNPMEELISLPDAMARLLEESVVRPRTLRRGEEAVLRLPLDAYETDEAIVISASLPGVNPDEVEITLEEDRLTIKGHFPPRLENVDYLITELPAGMPFARVLRINTPVEADKAEAAFKDGMLTLTLPKAQAARPKVIKIK